MVEGSRRETVDIGKDWRIESDTLNVTILKRSHIEAKNGKPAHDNWYPRGYFSNPKNALRWLVLHKVMGAGMKDLEAIVDSIEDVYDLIDGVVYE